MSESLHEPGEPFNLPDIIRTPKISAASEFAGLVALSNEAGLAAWFGEHRSTEMLFIERVTVLDDIAKEFAKPVPRAETALWRDSASYEYGDELPDVQLAVDFDRERQQVFAPYFEETNDGFTTVMPHSGFSLEVGLPHKDNDNISILELPFRVAKGMRRDGTIDMPELQLHLGQEIGANIDSMVSERASQEMSIVVSRLLQLESGTDPADITPRLPYDRPPSIDDLSSTSHTDPDSDEPRQSRRMRWFGF